MSKVYRFFPYSWHIDEKEVNNTCIRIYGLNEKDESVCVRVNDFTPFCYLELPTHIDWTEDLAMTVVSAIRKKIPQNEPYQYSFHFKKKLYYASFDGNGDRKKYPFLFLTFSNKQDITQLMWKIKDGLMVLGLGKIRFKMHEHNADQILQLVCRRNIPTAGWIEFLYKEVEDHDKLTYCKYEFMSSYKSMREYKCDKVPKPKILSYDIEVNSSIPTAFPSSDRKDDKIFQISCILSNQGDNEDKYDKYLLSTGEPSQLMVGTDVTIYMYNTEGDLLDGFTEFVNENNPNIIIGFNIFGFDIKYMLDRSITCQCNDTFTRMGFLKNVSSKEKLITWSSSAYGEQNLKYLDTEGRLFIDILPIIKRNYKLDTYNLKTVSSNFIGDTKDDLSPSGIFKCYKMGLEKNENNEFTEKAKKAMGICGKYAVKDSLLVTKLFEKLQIWVDLVEMAKVTNVPIIVLYTQGQQIKVFSQVYKNCMYEGYVVEKDGYKVGENEHYTGAHVFDPIIGVHYNVIPLDFTSLYPSTIIASNICWSTLVSDKWIVDDYGDKVWIRDKNIKDEDCHVICWEDHQGCDCDKRKYVTRPKNIMCEKRKYRFLKSPMGILPKLLTSLLQKRCDTKDELKIIKNRIKTEVLSEDEKNDLELLSVVLDKRQLALKVSANSAYGALGVQKGMLPLMPGAMCTTAKGREYLLKTAEILQTKYNAKLIYGDTDSNYVVFGDMKDKSAKEIWEYSEKVAEEVSSNFPSAISLAFEEKIYTVFMILAKKKYMCMSCNKEGKVSAKIEKRGCVLVRRDVSKFVQEVYEKILNKIFKGDSEENIKLDLQETISDLFNGNIDAKKFIITKAIKGTNNLERTDFLTEQCLDRKGNPKKDKNGNLKVRNTCRIGSYKILTLDKSDQNKCIKQMHDKKTNDEDEFYLRSLGAHVQLAEKLKRRGKPVQTGTRLEYVITWDNTLRSIIKDNQWEKIESYEYYSNHKDMLYIDYMYYFECLSSSLDEILNVIFTEKNYIDTIYKQKLEALKILDKSKPKIKFLDD